MPLGVPFLRWGDVDPATRAFDPSLARAAALDVVTRALRGHIDHAPPPGLERDAVEVELTTALVAAYGAWMVAWTWAATEPGGGGPIRSYCCDDHSLFAEDDVGGLPTVDRVVAAATEWRVFLEELAVLYAELRTATARLDVADRTEHAASRLVALVVERTGAEDAWYATFAQLLRWFLEFCGDVVDEHAIAEVVCGRFESWVAPHPATIDATVRELGAAVRQPPATRDALAIWLDLRDRALDILRSRRGERPVEGDAHRTFIETHDRARDPVRATRMLAALDACRASARAGESLTFERLATWQQLVLGTDAPPRWRTADAFARHVRYAYTPDLPARFDAALAQANTDEEPAIRAARVYLDVAFFHPFVDGNARAARLALDHVLSRAGLGLHAIEPLIVIARAADDMSGAYSLGAMIDQLAGKRP